MNETLPDYMSVEFDHEKQRTLFTQTGPIDKENVIEANVALHAAEGFDPSYDTIVDYRGITKVELGVQDLKEIIEAIKNTDKRTGRGAMVIGPNIGRLAFAKLFCDLSGAFSKAKVRYKAFHTVAEAEAWLDSK